MHSDGQLGAAATARALGVTALTPVPGGRDPKVAERVAAALEAEVIRAGWPVGQMIGSEDQLAQRYGVGRAVVREAIRLAEHRQVVRMRRGRGGGLVVVEPDASAVTESLAIFLEYAQADLADLVEARAVVDGFSAAVAAAAQSQTTLLQQLLESAHLVPDCAGAPTDAAAARFHALVAESTASTALILFARVIAALTSRLLARAPRPEFPPSAAPNRHAAIVAAIAAGDSERARQLAQADIRDLSERTACAGALPAGPEAAATGEQAGKLRPADVVAARIRRDILDRGWPVGESLGFEPDLLQRYGIGRAQFREAIRILENHSVVRMHRGVTGGMVVTAPDGRAVVRAVSLYLTYQGVDARDLRDLRAELEGATLRLAVERLTPDGADRLRAALEVERTWPDDNFQAVSHDLHAVIAELSGNRTLGLLQSIAMQLTAERLYTLVEQISDAGGPPPGTEAANAIRDAHAAIVEAMIAGDGALAQRLMSEHLSGLAKPTIEGIGNYH